MPACSLTPHIHNQSIRSIRHSWRPTYRLFKFYFQQLAKQPTACRWRRNFSPSMVVSYCSLLSPGSAQVGTEGSVRVWMFFCKFLTAEVLNRLRFSAVGLSSNAVDWLISITTRFRPCRGLRQWFWPWSSFVSHLCGCERNIHYKLGLLISYALQVLALTEWKNFSSSLLVCSSSGEL